MARTKTFDPKCHDLACDFLDDSTRKATPADQNALAAHIQEAIEDWIEDFEQEGPK